MWRNYRFRERVLLGVGEFKAALDAVNTAGKIKIVGFAAGVGFDEFAHDRAQRNDLVLHAADVAAAMTERTMSRLLMGYLERLPGAMHETELPDGGKLRQCGYSPHSLRAITATLLLDSGVAIEAVQDLLDHKHITTTQIYDKRRRAVKDSASHKMPI